MTQGARTTPEPVEDLDVLLQSRSLKPTKVKMFGRTWTVKRDFTPAQIAEFWLYVDEGRSSEAIKMVVGAKDEPAMSTLIKTIPTELINPPMRRLYQIAGVLKRPNDTEESEQGESEAS